MHLRNQVKEEEFLFDPEINKTLRQLKLKNKRELKNRAVEQSGGAIMAEEPNGHENQHQEGYWVITLFSKDPDTSQVLLFLTLLER